MKRNVYCILVSKFGNWVTSLAMPHCFVLPFWASSVGIKWSHQYSLQIIILIGAEPKIRPQVYLGLIKTIPKTIERCIFPNTVGTDQYFWGLLEDICLICPRQDAVSCPHSIHTPLPPPPTLEPCPHWRGQGSPDGRASHNGPCTAPARGPPQIPRRRDRSGTQR